MGFYVAMTGPQPWRPATDRVNVRWLQDNGLVTVKLSKMLQSPRLVHLGLAAGVFSWSSEGL